jgi:hypothetical protein
MPGLQGEAQVTPILISIAKGENTIPSLGISWRSKENFGMTRDYLYLDTRLRFTVGRFSAWCSYEPREFVGDQNFMNNPSLHSAEARFDYSGIRVGGGVDIFVGYGARVGCNLDFDLYRPIFQEAIQTRSGKKIRGDSPLTLGAHVAYNPVTNWYGLSGVFEAKARWSVQVATVFDLEVCGGLKAPETILGAWALN